MYFKESINNRPKHTHKQIVVTVRPAVFKKGQLNEKTKRLINDRLKSEANTVNSDIVCIIPIPDQWTNIKDELKKILNSGIRHTNNRIQI